MHKKELYFTEKRGSFGENAEKCHENIFLIKHY